MNDANPEVRRLLHGWLDDTLLPDEATTFLRLLAERPDLANDLAAAALTENALETYFAGASNFTRWDQLLADECRRVERQRNRRRITYAALAAAALITLGLYFLPHGEDENQKSVPSSLSLPRLAEARRSD